MKSVLILSLCVWMLSSNRFNANLGLPLPIGAISNQARNPTNPPQINKLSSNYAKCNDRLAEPDD